MQKLCWSPTGDVPRALPEEMILSRNGRGESFPPPPFPYVPQIMIPQHISAQTLPNAQEYSLVDAPCRAHREIIFPLRSGTFRSPSVSNVQGSKQGRR